MVKPNEAAAAPTPEWFRILINGRMNILVVGYREAQVEKRRLAAANPGADVRIESDN